MLPPLRLGVELPPVPAVSAGGPGRAGAVSLEPWWQLVLASVVAGAGVVWFTGGPGPEDRPGDGPADPGCDSCDACTIAAAAVTLVDAALLGVVSQIPVDRHPAVLARDVTTLDVVSGGRAAVLLRWATAVPPRGLSAACEHLGEAVAVCRGVLQDEDPVFEGTYLHVAGAVNRPPPRRTGGPPLLVEVPAGAAELARSETGPASLLRQASSSVAGIVCLDDPREVASWQVLLEEEAASASTRGRPNGAPAVVCRTTLGAQRSRTEAAREAGAVGVLVRVPSGRASDEARHLGAGDAARIADDLAQSFEPWLA